MMEDAGYWIGGEVDGEVGSLDDRRRSQLRHAKVSETKYRSHLLVVWYWPNRQLVLAKAPTEHMSSSPY